MPLAPSTLALCLPGHFAQARGSILKPFFGKVLEDKHSWCSLLDGSLSRPPFRVCFRHGDLCEISYRDRSAFSLAFAYFIDGVVFCLSLLGWITVPNKRMSNLDSLICAGMASVKKNSWHFPKSKMAAGVVYCRLSLTVSLRIFVLEYPRRLQTISSCSLVSV